MPPSTPQIVLTEEKLQALLRDAVRQAVNETFIRLGVQIDNPLEMQKDFQHLRDWRVTTDGMKTKALLAAVGLLATGLAAALWLGVRSSLGLPPR
jgi:hypothetical protein